MTRFVARLMPWILCTCAVPCRAGLDAVHRETLTQNLDTLSSRWDQSAVDSANRILSTPSYTRTDWQEFFSTYFSTRPLTDELRNYISYPVFGWLTTAVRTELQEGLAIVLLDRFRSSLQADPASLGEAMWRDARHRQSLFNLNFLSSLLPSFGLLSPETNDRLYRGYRDLIRDRQDLFGGGVKFDTLSHYSLGLLRAQVYVALSESGQPDRARGDIASELSLTGLRARLWNEFSVLVLDNHGLDNAQLEFIHSLLSSVPSSKHTLRFLTVRDFLMNTTHGTLIRKGGDGALNYRMLINPWHNTISFDFDRVGGGAFNTQLQGSLPSHGWVHVAGVYDGAHARLYIDGKEVASRAVAGSVRTSSDPLHLGRDVYPSRGWHYRGHMDEVKIYRRALSPSEISAASTGAPVAADGIAAWYGMDESGGTALVDSSGSGNHGNLTSVDRIEGQRGKGLSFNGRNSVAEIPGNSSLAIADVFTVSMFVRAPDENRDLHSSSWMINIFGGRIGESSENGFPADVERYEADLFSLVAVHELNHVIDISHVEGCARQHVACSPGELASRKKILLGRAGHETNQYLRSMFGSFFQTAPQEFFASISNQYFANTERTLQLALKRFDAGFREPLNQFLWFAEAQAWDATTIPFYTLGTNGILRVSTRPVVRSANGHISGFSSGGKNYLFDRDASGNVVGISATEGLRSAGRFVHLASGGGWKTTITIINLSAQTARASLRFRSANGNDLRLPFRNADSGISEVMSEAAVVLPGHGIASLESDAGASSPVLTGWAELATDGSVSGSLIFGLTGEGGRIAEAVVPLETRSSPKVVFSFDNQLGFSTGIALANQSVDAASIEVLARDERGITLGTGRVNLAPGGHDAFDAAVRFGFLSGRKGTLEVSSSAPLVSVIGLRFNPTGSFTTIPVIPK